MTLGERGPARMLIAIGLWLTPPVIRDISSTLIIPFTKA
jgi:hypothetical protein